MSIYEASVQQAFTAGHSLPLPTGGREEVHKHTWLITASFRARQLDPTMAVAIDFVAVEVALKTIAAGLEGTDLSELDAFIDDRPSAERVAQIVAERLMDDLRDLLTAADGDGPWLHCVSVTEAPGCVAAYLPNEE
ncbi:MAG: 6-pyruvoyl trahydropterin synthase family protein [Planctomycetota bacterium]|jgi:6-pyruvoyl-tetrahydropterin synthase